MDELRLDAEDLLCAEHIKDKLNKDDLVLVYRLNDEQYVIIEKVVEMDVSV